MIFTPNSHGDTHHMLEKWSDAARAAAAAARRASGRPAATRRVIQQKRSKRDYRRALHYADAMRYAEFHKPVPHGYREHRWAPGTYD